MNRRSRTSIGTVCPDNPSRDRLTRPSRINRVATHTAVSIPMAKQMPCAGAIVAVLMPTTRPAPDTNGPPEFPGFSGASVWITLSMNRPDGSRSVRPSAETMPAVTVQLETERIADRHHKLAHAQRRGLTQLGVWQSAAGQAQHRGVGIRVRAHQGRIQGLPVGERGAQPRGTRHHMGVGQHVAIGGVEDAGTLAFGLPSAPNAMTCTTAGPTRSNAYTTCAE